MKMNGIREKYLIEAMGRKFYHCMMDAIYTDKGMVDEWRYFGMLWEWARKQIFWGNFVEHHVGMDSDEVGPLFWGIDQAFIDPEMFATILYAYLQEREKETS